LNGHGIIPNTLRGEIISTYNLCHLDSKHFMKELLEREVNEIMKIRKKHTKVSEPWFPLTRAYLAHLVYQVVLILLLLSMSIGSTSIMHL